MPSTRKLNKYFDVYTHTYDIYKYIYMRRLAFPLATQKEMTWITLLPTEKWIKCINYFLYPMQTGIYSQYSAYDTQIT